MNKVYMIGNTHFDPVWLWKWDEAMSSITATFRSALDRMAEYPEFKYSFATPPVFEWIKKTSPQMFEEIKQRVIEGRWELAEGWWVQPDCYTPSGESLVRQGLYGQIYLNENFGRYSETVFNIDSFGHPPTLPQILSKSRIKYYVFCRPEERHIELKEPLFNWTSRDGSSVLAYRNDTPYQDTADAIAKARKLNFDSLQVYGVTDHGGAPTVRSIEQIKTEENAVFSTVKEFFDRRNTDYSVSKELLTGDFGVYANNPEIKALNRKAEYAVLNAEKASLFADNYDKETIRKCWHDILFNQFHDILGGASIKEAYFDARNMFGRAISTANEILHYNLLRLTNKIDMPGKNPDNAWNIVVWNLNAKENCGYFEAEVQWAHEFPWYDKGICLEDGFGNKYECQIIRERSVIPGFRSRFLFKAQIPPLGYKAFKVIQTNEEILRPRLPCTNVFETERYTVTLSKNGMVESIYDKTGKTKIQGRLLNPAFFADDGDTWAFNIDGYGEELEEALMQSLEMVESGALRTVFKVTYSFRASKIELYYTLYGKETYIDVGYRVNWNEKHVIFKLMTDIDVTEHTVSVPYGRAERAESKAEMPMGEWLKTDKLTFAADHIFAYTVAENKLGLTVLRSPIYGDLRICDIDLEEDYDIMEQGITEGKIRVSFDKSCDALPFAAGFNNPPVVLCASNHKGDIGSRGSFAGLESESVFITVLKKSENSRHTIARGVEYSGKKQTCKLTVNNIVYEFNVDPYEIFTLKLDGCSAVKVDMLEDSKI